MNQRRNLIRTLMIAAALLAVAGCATTPPPTFYQLEEPASTQLTGLERGIAIGVGPVTMAAYLDRPQIVSRAEAHKLVLSEFNVWVEPLKESITRVIGVNLSNMMKTTRIFRYPRRDRTIPIAYRVAIDIARFDGKLGGNVQLLARWTLYSGQDDNAILTRVSIITEASGGEGYEKMIAAQNRSLQKLSREIADAIKELQ